VGVLLRLSGQSAAALGPLQKRLVLAEQLESGRPGEPDESQWLMRLNSGVAEAQRGLGNVTASATHRLRALEAVRRWYARHPDENSRSYVATGLWGASTGVQDAGDLERAARFSREEIAIREDLIVLHPDDPATKRATLNSYEQLATVLSHADHLSLEDRAAARPFYEKVLVLAQQLASLDPTNVQALSDLVIARRNLCEVMLDADPRGAAEQCLQGLELSQRAPVVHEIYGPRILAGAGDAHRRMKNYHSALDFLRRALDAEQRAVARDSAAVNLRQTLLSIHQRMGTLFEEMSDRAAALESHRRALAVAEDMAKGPADPLVRRDLADCYENLGRCHEGYDWRQALAWYQKSLNVWTEWPNTPPSTRVDQMHRERAFRAVNKCAAALASASRN
jgi:tetratricopeptide (TPR) repeat protein